MRTFAALALLVVTLCIPTTAQNVAETRHPQQSAPAPEDRIDINHATLQQLLKAPGMTASWAGRIVRFRPYRTKQDLLDRGVVPGDVYQRIKDSLIAHREAQ